MPLLPPSCSSRVLLSVGGAGVVLGDVEEGLRGVGRGRQAGAHSAWYAPLPESARGAWCGFLRKWRAALEQHASLADARSTSARLLPSAAQPADGSEGSVRGAKG